MAVRSVEDHREAQGYTTTTHGKRSETMRLFAIAAMPVLVASQAFAGSYEVRCETKSVPYEDTVKGGNPKKSLAAQLLAA